MKISASRSLIVIASLIGAALGMAGCADYASVGVGYGDAYYVPDYRPFYADYFYDGVPWWGPNYYYTRKKIVVKDVDKHVNINKTSITGGTISCAIGADEVLLRRVLAAERAFATGVSGGGCVKSARSAPNVAS